MIENILIEKAEIKHANKIHSILLQAFHPYFQYYTSKAYQATVLSVSDIEKRIQERKFTVLIAKDNRRIVGTASLQKKKDELYLCSMAVDPTCQNKGVGNLFISEIQKYAVLMKCKCITLETYHRLENAVLFYKNQGFEKTGTTRNYYGIPVFEMKKELPTQTPL